MTRILIIEDQPENRIVLRHVLHKHEYEVIEAEDGAQGVALAQIKHPQLIICDINMPEMNGFEVAQNLLENPLTKHIPMVFLTAHQDEDTMRQAMRLGASNFLTKPVTPHELVETVQQVLSGEAPAPQADDEPEA